MTMEKDAIFQKFVVPAAKAAGKSVGKYLKTAWRGHGTNTAMKGAADDAITKYTNEGLKGAVRRGAVTSAITGTGTGGLSYMRARGQGYSPEEARAKALKAGVVGGALGGAVGGAWGKMRLPALRNRAALLAKISTRTYTRVLPLKMSCPVRKACAPRYTQPRERLALEAGLVLANTPVTCPWGTSHLLACQEQDWREKLSLNQNQGRSVSSRIPLVTLQARQRGGFCRGWALWVCSVQTLQPSQ